MKKQMKTSYSKNPHIMVIYASCVSLYIYISCLFSLSKYKQRKRDHRNSSIYIILYLTFFLLMVYYRPFIMSLIML